MATASWKQLAEFLDCGPASWDVRAALGPLLKEPFAEHCRAFRRQLKGFFDSRAEIATKVDEFLFGREGQIEKAVNDTGQVLRKSLTDMGFDSTYWVWEAPERPLPHSELQFQRKGLDKPRIELRGLSDPPTGTAAPHPAPEGLRSYDSGLVHAWHLSDQHEAAATSHAVESFSDLRVTYCTGAHAGLVPLVLQFFHAFEVASAWLEPDPRRAEEFKRAHINAFPRVVLFGRRLVDIDALKISVLETEFVGAKQVLLEFPLDFAAGQEHYPNLMELLGLLDPLSFQLRHPETKALLMDVSLTGGNIRCASFVKDGRVVCASEENALPLHWDKTGNIEMLIEIEFSLLPFGRLGAGLAAIPFPRMTFKCLFSRSGAVTVTCLEAQESALDVVGSMAFDVQALKKLLVSTFRFELSHMATSPDLDSWVVSAFLRIAFPTSSIAQILSQWFRDTVHKLVSQADLLKAMTDLLEAAAEDALVLSLTSGKGT